MKIKALAPASRNTYSCPSQTNYSPVINEHVYHKRQQNEYRTDFLSPPATQIAECTYYTYTQTHHHQPCERPPSILTTIFHNVPRKYHKKEKRMFFRLGQMFSVPSTFLTAAVHQVPKLRSLSSKKIYPKTYQNYLFFASLDPNILSDRDTESSSDLNLDMRILCFKMAKLA